MMGPSWNARFVAKVLGIPAVMGLGILASVWLVQIVLHADVPDAMKYFVLGLFGLLILVPIAWRMCAGGEQGPTDIVIQETVGGRVITATNVHLAGGPTREALAAFERMPPVPRPIGRVHGNPAHLADVVVDAQAALPAHVRVAEQPIEVPENAQGLAVNPPADEVKATDVPDVKLSGEQQSGA